MTEFKPQAWHVETNIAYYPEQPNNVLSAFISKGVAEEARDEWNADNNRIGFPGNAYICLCDCPNRDCQYLEDHPHFSGESIEVQGEGYQGYNDEGFAY